MHDIDGRALASLRCDINHAAKVRRKRQSAVTRIAFKLSNFAADAIFDDSHLGFSQASSLHSGRNVIHSRSASCPTPR